MAPVVAVAAHPGREARRNHRPRHPRRELLHACEQGVAVDDERQGLDDAGVGVGLHGGGEAHDGVAGHQAVGVEHEHVLVGAAPAGHEVGDVAGLAVVVLGPVAIKNPRLGAEPFAQGQKRALLGDPGLRVGRIRQDEIVEMRAEARCFDRLADRLQRREGPRRRLVVDRHQHGGARVQSLRQRRKPVPTHEQGQKAEQAAGEGERDPREIEGEERQQHPLEHRRAADRHHLIHLACAVSREQRRTAEDEHPRQPRRAGALGRGERTFLRLRPVQQRLHRHLEPVLGRQTRFTQRRGERMGGRQGVQR
jgi:hypothetical protein